MPVTVRKLMKLFFAWADQALRPNTVASYRQHLDKFLKHVGNKQVRNLKPTHLTAWAKTWHEVQAVIRLFNWAVNDERILRNNPFKRVRKPRRGMRRRIMGERQIAQLLRSLNPYARALLLALRETAARPQELRGVVWEEVISEEIGESPLEALAKGRALIVQIDFKDCERRSDSSRPRVLLISKRLGRLLLRLHRDRKQLTGPIFVNTRGEAWTRNAVNCFMRRVRARLALKRDHRGENIVAYTLRHSVATIAASRGVRDRTLADLLGHVETRTTSRYLHLQVDHLREAMRRARGETGNETKQENNNS